MNVVSVLKRLTFLVVTSLVVSLLTGLSIPALAQISITSTGASYSENFDGMGPADSAYRPGWTGIRYAGTGTIGATLPARVGTGSGNSGDVYNFGSSSASDRALGMLASGSTIPRIGAQFANNTGVTITIINMAGVMEQWRSGDNAQVETDAFEYSFDATSLTTGTWTSATGMDLVEKLTSTTTAAAVDGNAAANRTNISATVSGLNWTNGSTMWIRWSDVNNTGTDGALAIDDLTMSFNIVPPPPGRGTAYMAPSLAQGAVNDTLTVVVKGQSPYTLTNTNVVVPSIFSWSHTTGDVTLTGGGSPSLAISGDTIKVSSMTVTSADSIQIKVKNVTPPDSTDSFILHTQTGTQPDSMLDLSSQPSVLIYGTPHAIGDIKQNDVNGVPIYSGKFFTILGVVTVGGEFGSPSYIQDATGGIAVFGVITSSQVAIGDEVEIVGSVSPFNGLTELGNPTLIKKVSSGNVVTPLVLTCHQANFDGVGGVEQYEGRLIRINQVIVTTLAGGAVANWTVAGSGTNYRLQDTDTLEVRVDNNVNFANLPAPQAPFDIIGVLSQFKSASPFIGGYQLMPRTTADIISQGPIFATAPVESNLQPTSLRISWTTINNGTTRVKYGLTTAYELGIASPDNALGLSHAVDLTGLSPATIYHVQAFSDGGSNDTSYAGDLVVSSASPPASAGQINVYFNKSVDNSVSLGENAIGNQNMINLINNRIDNAHRSIDLALYSLSGGGYGDVIASHLISAKSRGVSIRVICEADNQAGGSIPTLSSAGIPVINDKFDAVWNGAGLMHNKFFVFDGRGGAPESIWVWGGSWNPTISGTGSDRQNSIEIQDQALAGAYTMEFNQMWGSSTETPNASVSRFGARKLDITPHNFLINGINVGSYFSPSDHTTGHIISVIAKAQHSVSTAILTYTRSDIADAMIARKNAGNKVRVVVDNNTDQGNQYAYLQSNAIDIHLKGGSGLLHHKYTTVDGDQASGPAYLETGSHNYSSSAENSNDENSLFFDSKRLANLYLQEFTARYYEAGGTDSIHITSGAGFSISKSSINFDTVLTSATKKDSFTVSNTGNLALVIAPLQISNARFTTTPESATVAAAGTQKFYVTFAPNAVGPQNGTIILTFNATGSPDTVRVQGVGKSGTNPIFNVTPSSLAFGSRPIGGSSIDSFTVSNPGTSLLHISNIASSNPKFTVVPTVDSVPASGSKKFIVTFSPTVLGVISAQLIIHHDAPSSPDTVTVGGTGVDTPRTMILTEMAGWNMFSVPLKVSNTRKDSLFPHAVSHAYGYYTSYYVPPNDSLLLGYGYWVKFDSADTVTLKGVPFTTDTIAVRAGWNMIGSVSHAVAVTSIVQNPASIVQSPYFGYNGGYTSADSIQPGVGYWVRVDTVGTLILSTSPEAQPKTSIASLNGMNELTFTDAKGRSQTLYFGAATDGAVNVNRYLLPPPPPSGGFDVRFASGRMVEVCSSTSQQSIQFPIAVQVENYPITVHWTATQDARVYTLVGETEHGHAIVRLEGKGEATIQRLGTGSLILTMAQEKPLPVVFALEQNYPNPFNPSTVIPFSVPEHAKVTLSVYNVLGEVVSVVLHDAEYDAGSYEVPFNASQLSSGVYYYRFEAAGATTEHFQQIKKLVLIK